MIKTNVFFDLTFRLRLSFHCLKEHVAEERSNDASLMYGRMVGNLQQQLHQQAQMASAANAANATRVQKEQEKVQSMVALEQHHHHQRLVHLTTRALHRVHQDALRQAWHRWQRAAARRRWFR